MSKKVETIENQAGGIDLLTERDGGNDVRILTGKRECSIDFWRRIRDAADEALTTMGAQ